VLCGMGLLAFTHVDAWRKGRIDFLERVIQGNPHKISSSLLIFRNWAHEKGLNPTDSGGGQARPGTVLGYIEGYVGTTAVKIPSYVA
jgi:hypothetical protein